MRNPLSISSNVPRTLISMSVSSFMVLLCGVALIVSAQQDVRGIRVTEDGRFCSNTEMIESKVSNKAPNLSALKRTEGRWSLVVGVDNYPDDKYFSLELAGGWQDAKALGETLVEYGGFETNLLSNAYATRKMIWESLSRMVQKAKSGPPELLLFSFSGHGFVYNGESYLLASDVKWNGKTPLLVRTSIRTSEIKEQIKRIGAKQVIILLDVCLVEIGDKSVQPEGQMEIDLRGSGNANITTIYATQLGYPSYEYKSKHMGYFTWAVVEGIRGGAANPEGVVSLKDLYSYLSSVVPQHVCRTINQFQKPFANIEGTNSDNVILSAVKP